MDYQGLTLFNFSDSAGTSYPQFRTVPHLLVQIIQSVRVLFDDRDAELLAHGLHVVVPDVTERFRVRLEAEVGDAPALKQPREDIGGLAPDDEQPRVQLTEVPIQVLQALKQEPGNQEDMAVLRLKAILNLFTDKA